MKKSSIQLLGLLHTLLLVQSHGHQRVKGQQGLKRELELTERELRRESGFPVSFFDEDNLSVPPLPNSHYPEGSEDVEQYDLHQPLSLLHRDREDDHDLFDPLDDDGVSPEHSVLGGGGASEGGAGAAATGLKQDENPLNFLNLAGTDFQPGRMVNIFFGLMIMIFMIVIHGYILWVVGIAYLPGTRSFGDGIGWEVDTESVFAVLTSVLDAIQYWNDMQIVEPPKNKD